MKKGAAFCNPPFLFFLYKNLFSKVKLFYNASVSLNVFRFKIIQKFTSLTYKPQKRSLCVVIFFVVF